MSTPSSMVGEQYRTGSWALLNSSSRSCRSAARAGQGAVAGPAAALARAGEGHAGRGGKLALGQRPRLPQMLGGEPPDLIEPVISEVLDVDGQVPAQFVQQRGCDLLAVDWIVI